MMKKFLVLLCTLLPFTVSAAVVKTGIDVLRERNFRQLDGMRVGLVTNPSGVDSRMRSTIDLLHNAPNLTLVALFGPEHGVRGDVYAGGKIADYKDPGTGVPVYSLYGATRKPTPGMLEGIDIMIYDIQDVGTRSYTFISTLGLVMRACAEQGIEVMVLDRPNPLGGRKVEGCYVRPGFFSFVSEFRIPYVYGLTVGELAVLINEEGLNCGQKGDEAPVKCKLTVIPMEGWNRDMVYTDTGLPWILPSPNIPSPQAAIGYPSSGICGELYGNLNIGVGYTIPFQTFAAEWIDAAALKEKLDSYNLPGTSFRTIWYKPTSGNLSGKLLSGVQFFFTDYAEANLTLTQFYVLQAIAELWPEKAAFKVSTGIGLFDKVCGTDRIRCEFAKRHKVEDISAFWQEDAEEFRLMSRKYYIYR